MTLEQILAAVLVLSLLVNGALIHRLRRLAKRYGQLSGELVTID